MCIICGVTLFVALLICFIWYVRLPREEPTDEWKLFFGEMTLEEHYLKHGGKAIVQDEETTRR